MGITCDGRAVLAAWGMGVGVDTLMEWHWADDRMEGSREYHLVTTSSTFTPLVQVSPSKQPGYPIGEPTFHRRRVSGGWSVHPLWY
jgi:hypothetical protein